MLIRLKYRPGTDFTHTSLFSLKLRCNTFRNLRSYLPNMIEVIIVYELCVEINMVHIFARIHTSMLRVPRVSNFSLYL